MKRNFETKLLIFTLVIILLSGTIIYFGFMQDEVNIGDVSQINTTIETFRVYRSMAPAIEQTTHITTSEETTNISTEEESAQPNTTIQPLSVERILEPATSTTTSISNSKNQQITTNTTKPNINQNTTIAPVVKGKIEVISPQTSTSTSIGNKKFVIAPFTPKESIGTSTISSADNSKKKNKSAIPKFHPPKFTPPQFTPPVFSYDEDDEKKSESKFPDVVPPKDPQFKHKNQ